MYTVTLVECIVIKTVPSTPIAIHTLQHLLVCKVLQVCLASHTIAQHKIVYEDLLSEDISGQKEATTLYQLVLDSRERILGTPAAGAGPLHCGDP